MADGDVILTPGGGGSPIILRLRRDGFDLGNLTQELTYIGAHRWDAKRVLATKRDRDVITLPIKIQGIADSGLTAVQDAKAQLTAITRALLRPATISFEIGSEPIVFRTLPSDGPVAPPDPEIWDGTIHATLKVRVEPYAYGDVKTLLAAVTTFPAAIDLSAMNGEYETPLSWSVVLAGMTQLYLGLLESEYADWTGWLLDANALSWTGGASAADAAAAGGAAWKITTVLASKTASIPVTDFPQGEYAFLVRARGLGMLWSSSIHDDADEGQTVASSTYKWYDLGRIVCPTKRTISPGSASASLTAEATTGDIWVDRIAFVRTAAGYVAYNGASVGRLDCDGEHTYADGIVNYAYIKGGVLYALGGKLCAIVEKAGEAASYSPTVTISAESRHNLWRAST